MFIMNQKRIKEEKINQLREGQTAFAETHELIRLIKRDILKYDLHVHCDETPSGCWFIPLHERISS
ncbi:hypothetical protein [Virgibacillus necropolis]|uniref:Adenosine deaminase domain-containing protein n=1 Tax=Virgibacillus necropolis TaxID=163877 RepID=A0A221MBF9_9BACI|nr:hypothetical protein [Virgibacillus necropolis]ASN05008.1 hypothetical protein CFK40_08280 [Virgibacillus necropolis]